METRIAVIGIMIEDHDAVLAVNQILHQYSSYIVGRMGLPYPKKKVNIISIVIDAPQNIISACSGQLGKILGVSAKVLSTKTGSS